MSPQPYRELIMSKWNEPEVPTIELSHQNLFEDWGPIDKIIGYPIYALLIFPTLPINPTAMAVG